MDKLTNRIMTAKYCSTQYLNDHLTGLGLRGAQYTIVLMICENPGISQESLSRLIYLNKSNTARHLAQLEENGYVLRRSSQQDKRVQLVYPTEKAEKMVPSIQKVYEEWNAYLSSSLTEDEQTEFDALLDKIILQAKTYIDSKN